jgi:phage terminase Nu1 subunit (DNA packaging protein)
MRNNKSYIVIGKGQDGLEVWRHPYIDLEMARSRAKQFALENIGATFYVAEIRDKVYVPVVPVIVQGLL